MRTSNLLIKLSGFQLPNLTSVFIATKKSMSKDEETDILNFMRLSLPPQLKEFRIYNEHKNILSYEHHRNVLLSTAKKVTNVFSMWDYRLDVTNLTEIIETFYNVNHLDLYRWKFGDFKSDLKIGKDIQFNIKGLDLRWITGLDLVKMQKIVDGLATNQSMVNSLEYVWITGTRMSIEQLQIMFTLNHFNVLIW